MPIIFDRNAKRAQRDRAALRPRSREYDHLKDSIAARLADRLYVMSLSLPPLLFPPPFLTPPLPYLLLVIKLDSI